MYCHIMELQEIWNVGGMLVCGNSNVTSLSRCQTREYIVSYSV